MENNYCIYKHTTPEEKVYIGQTNNPKRRWRNGEGYKISSPNFYKAIQKYGWENIQHEILISNLTKEEADQKEIELIALYNARDKDKGYNISPGGIGGNQKPTVQVNMYSLEGIFIQSFDSAASAARAVKTNRTNIIACCNKRAKSAAGYRWSYIQEKLDWDFINNNARSKNNGNSVPIKITDLETKETKIFSSRQSAINYYNFSKGGFMYCLNNKKTSFPKIYLKKYLLEEV